MTALYNIQIDGKLEKLVADAEALKVSRHNLCKVMQAT
jgi:hypothetical protein